MNISVITPSIRPRGLDITRQCLMQQTFQDFEWLVEIGLGRHDLNAAYNRMLRRSQGELIVSLQDFIKVEPDFLQQYWDAYQRSPDTFFTAPVGKVQQEDFSGEVAWDWRIHKEARPFWNKWEIDSGSAPRAALFAIGGFDEALDKYWSSDNVNVGFRAHLAGYKFGFVPENRAMAYDHDAHMTHPYRHKFKPDYNNKRLEAFRRGLRINYLA